MSPNHVLFRWVCAMVGLACAVSLGVHYLPHAPASVAFPIGFSGMMFGAALGAVISR